ncbi:MAG: hypothetical protein PHP93_08995 [Kiritimatiellales bacterium]|nr:hypothetical protein [Kiritimatiellales bacterium]
MRKTKLKSKTVRALLGIYTLLLFTGCATISEDNVAKQTGIPAQSIRTVAKCSYTATDAGRTSGSSSYGIFVLTDHSICIYNALDVSKISGNPVYNLGFQELDSVAVASYALVKQLQFYQGPRVLAVTLWNQFELPDKEKATQVHDYMTKQGLTSRPNCEVIFMGAPNATY